MYANSQPNANPPDLDATPRFKKPPVIETVLAVQFKPLSLNVGHYGKIYEALQSKGFSTVEQYPSVPHIIEQRKTGSFIDLSIFAQMAQVTAGQPRYRFLSPGRPEGERFVQLQNDCLIQNWRRSNSSAGSYPSYSKNREEFADNLSTLASIIEHPGLGKIVADQCEVTYVNQIPLEQFSGVSEAFQECFGLSIPARPLAHARCEAEHLAFQSNHWVEEANGRLYIQAAVVASLAPMIMGQKQSHRFSPNTARSAEW